MEHCQLDFARTAVAVSVGVPGLENPSALLILVLCAIALCAAGQGKDSDTAAELTRRGLRGFPA